MKILNTDLHNHTRYSFDSALTMDESVRNAINRGIELFGFSDHLDFAADDPGAHYYRATEQYEEYLKIRDKYISRINLRLGIEASYEAYYYDKTKSVINSIPFDYVIMSVHFVQGIVMSQWVKSIEEGKQCVDDVDYRPYFRQMNELVTKADFDILGHMDYYKKYSRFSHEHTFEKYNNEIADILHILCDRGKILEINTSGLRYTCKEQFPSESMLALYSDKGGRIISVGSDSHKTEHIGCCIDTAAGLANKYNFHIFKPEVLCLE